MPRLRHFALACAGGAALLAAPAAAAPLNATSLIDRPGGDAALPSDGLNFSIFQSSESLSADGNRVVFESLSDALAAPDGKSDSRYVFVRDRAAGTTTNVCRADGAAGAVADAFCNNASISRNGRYVTFTSAAHNLVPAAVTGSQLYRRDLQTNITDLVSRRTGAAGNASAGVDGRGSVADDGTAVFTTATALDAIDTGNSRNDVYARVGTTTVLISRTSGATVGNGGSEDAVISGNGGRVAFRTDATNFDIADQNQTSDIYSAPISGLSTPTLESRKPSTGAAGNLRSDSPVLSETGRYLAFQTTATNIFSAPITSDTNGQQDVILRDTTANTNTVASIMPGGVLGNGASTTPAIAADGSAVVFSTDAFNLGATVTDDNGVAVVRTPATNSTVVTSRLGGPGTAATPAYPGGLSTSAGIVALNMAAIPGGGGNNLVYVESVGGSSPELVSRASSSGASYTGVGYSSLGKHAVSADGRYVTYLSSSSGLTADPTGDPAHVFVRDQLLGTTTLVDRAGGPSGTPSTGYPDEPTISADGSTVAFTSDASDLSQDADGKDDHVFVVKLATGAVQVADRPAAGGAPAGNVGDDPLALSADGAVVAFASYAKLAPADTNTTRDVYVRNLSAGTTVLASRADGPSGAAPDAGAGSAALSADGTKVAFTSGAKNLVADDDKLQTDAFVRDLVAGSTTLVSRANGVTGAAGNSYSAVEDLSADGTKVAFLSNADNLGDGTTSGTESLHLRDLVAGTTTWASRTSSGAEPDGEVLNGALSADGTRVMFSTKATNQGPPDANGALVDMYVGDLVAATLARVSVADGVGGAQAALGSSSPSLSANGQCAVFMTASAGLVPGGYASTDFQHVFERAFGGACPVAPPVPAIAAPSNTGTVVNTVKKDTTAPVVSNVALAKKAFTVKGKKKGTTITFSLSEPASVKLAVATLVKGKRSGKSCVAPKKAAKKAKACTRVGATQTVSTLNGKAGSNRIGFTGQVGKKVLKRGVYRFVVTATDAAGNVGTATIGFTVR